MPPTTERTTIPHPSLAARPPAGSRPPGKPGGPKAGSAPTLRVLFADDEPALQTLYGNELPRMGHDVTVCKDGVEAIEALDADLFDAAIIDLRMPGKSGWDVIDHLKKVQPDVEVIISTGHGNMDDAISALRLGAFDFLPKPAKLATVANLLKRVGERKALANRADQLETQLKAKGGQTEIIGDTPVMQQVKDLIAKVAPTESSVLILGETGTGKELIARSIHEQSNRARMPFVAVNCGALPENLVESELFGHKKGAFTGADAARKGLIEVANGGTLFLDELGELDKSMQVKLLRFLESGEVRRVGENDAFTVDVRIVCATNRQLKEMSEEGEFREDLFFRVNTFEVRLPALRDRKDDIPEIALHLIARVMKKPSVDPSMLTDDAKAALLKYDWGGNVRELANAVEHACILSGGEPIEAQHLPHSVLGRRKADGRPFDVSAFPEPMTLRAIEQEVIMQTLDLRDGDKPSTAKELGIALKTLYNKLHSYDAMESSAAA